MLLKPQIEAWAFRVIDAVQVSGPTEDAFVELKSAWPDDAARAARRLAGHANSARGSDILWLIGVDEKNGKVTGAPFEELANWLTKAMAMFADGIGEGIALEVPWRDGTKIRTAQRHELLSIVAPPIPRPRLNLLNGAVHYKQNPEKIGFHSTVSIYAVPTSAAPVCFPLHEITANLRLGNNTVDADEIRPQKFQAADVIQSMLASARGWQPPKSASEPSNVQITHTEILLRGPGRFQLTITFESLPAEGVTLPDECILQIHFKEAVSEAVITLAPKGQKTASNYTLQNT